MAALVTTEEVRVQLRLTPTDMADADNAILVPQIAERATDIVIDYIKRPDHEWTDGDAPPLIKAGILLACSVLFEDREGDPLTDAVRSVVHRYRDPALA